MMVRESNGGNIKAGGKHGMGGICGAARIRLNPCFAGMSCGPNKNYQTNTFSKTQNPRKQRVLLAFSQNHPQKRTHFMNRFRPILPRKFDFQTPANLRSSAVRQ
jgi:hypothetical protein